MPTVFDELPAQLFYAVSGAALVALLVAFRNSIATAVLNAFHILTKQDVLAPYLGSFKLHRTEHGFVIRPSIRVFRDYMLRPRAAFYLPADMGGAKVAVGKVELWGDQLWIDFRSKRRNQTRRKGWTLAIKLGEAETGCDLRLAVVLATKAELGDLYSAKFLVTRDLELDDKTVVGLIGEESTLKVDLKESGRIFRAYVGLQKEAARTAGFTP